LIAVETFPDLTHPSAGRFAWGEILKRKIELTHELQASWFIHHDADEIRESPWPGVNLRDAIRWVDRLGYNAIDFRLFNFRPVDDEFRPGMDPKAYFTRFEYAAEYDKMQIKCWRAGPAAISLADGGHEVRFEGRSVFPIPFILRHYPIRGQAHGRRKVFEERKGRFLESERAAGWHVQYDSIEREDHTFLRNPASLLPFDIDRARLEVMLSSRVRWEELDESLRPQRGGEKQDLAAVEGFLDRATCKAIYGWAWDRNRPDTPLHVDIWGGQRLLGTVRADRFRQDLCDAGKGDGRVSFFFVPPGDLHDSQPHLIWVNIVGTSISLMPSPRRLICACRETPRRGSHPV
jgi:hypothetical protein